MVRISLHQTLCPWVSVSRKKSHEYETGGKKHKDRIQDFLQVCFFALGRKQGFPDFKITQQKLWKLSIDGRKVNFLPLKSKQNFYRI